VLLNRIIRVLIAKAWHQTISLTLKRDAWASIMMSTKIHTSREVVAQMCLLRADKKSYRFWAIGCLNAILYETEPILRSQLSLMKSKNCLLLAKEIIIWLLGEASTSLSLLTFYKWMGEGKVPKVYIWKSYNLPVKTYTVSVLLTYR
jgi:hypothetical protein